MKTTVIIDTTTYPCIVDNIEVETDDIRAYNIELINMKVIDEVNKRKLDLDNISAICGFVDEESASEFLKENDIAVKLQPVCLLSFIYHGKKYSSIYVPDFENVERVNWDKYELTILGTLFNDKQYIATHNISIVKAKSFIDLFINANFATKDYIDNLFLYGQMGTKENKPDEYYIEVQPGNSLECSPVTENTLAIFASDVKDIQISNKEILSINIKDKIALDNEMCKCDTFSMSQKDILDYISKLDFVDTIKIEKVRMYVKNNYAIEDIAFKPIKNESIRYWVYLNGYELEFKNILPYNSRIKNMLDMYKYINQRGDK